MAILPTRRDGNGLPLHGRGTELITKRFTGIGTSGVDISLGADVKEALLHVEGATEAVRITGTAAGSEEIRITGDGLTIEDIALVREAGETIARVAAPSGTIDVSVMGWR
jgi:hypothetical protein